ncbi:MAG: fasciclin domain-containing protein, partial [Candidatus Bathyarchaeota archaeon]|nr:fasciclin domain-containing protein [Candidatus Bathyarchaeum sp.]
MADIVDIAVEAGGFKTFVAAVQAAGLVETLKRKGPFTIFAPNDEAFANLPTGTVDGLWKDIPKLKAILMYHIVIGKFTVDEIGQMKTMKTFQGQELNIDAAHWWTMHWNPLVNKEHIVNTDV